jgi:hypothetical protein
VGAVCGRTRRRPCGTPDIDPPPDKVSVGMAVAEKPLAATVRDAGKSAVDLERSRETEDRRLAEGEGLVDREETLRRSASVGVRERMPIMVSD